jgi:hypothetical protein
MSGIFLWAFEIVVSRHCKKLRIASEMLLETSPHLSEDFV